MTSTPAPVTTVEKINHLITKHCNSSQDELRAISSHIHTRLKQLKQDKNRAMMAVLKPGVRVILVQSMGRTCLCGARGVVTAVMRTRIRVLIDGISNKNYIFPARCVSSIEDTPQQATASVPKPTSEPTWSFPETEKASKELYLKLERDITRLRDKLAGTEGIEYRNEIIAQINAKNPRLEALSDHLGIKFGFDCDDAMDDDFLC
jgi:hypothetical protein